MWSVVQCTAFLFGLTLLRYSKVNSKENAAPSVFIFALKRHPFGMRIFEYLRFFTQETVEHAQRFM